MRVNFSSSFLTDLERIDSVIMIDSCKIDDGDKIYNPEVIYHDGIVQACIIGVNRDNCGKLEFYYNGELTYLEVEGEFKPFYIGGKLAFTITSSIIDLTSERAIFKFNLNNLGRSVKADIGCPWLTNDTKFIESIGVNLGLSLYKDIEVSPDSLIWKESIGKYVTDRGVEEDHNYNVERIDTKPGILESRPIKFKSYKNIIIEQGNWKIESIKNIISEKHDVYSEISSSVFYYWNSPMIDATVDFTEEPECEVNFGEYLNPGGVVLEIQVVINI